MKYQMLVFKDEVAEAFLLPFFLPNENMAKREFVNAVSNPEHKFNQNAEDFTLYNVGTYDDETALFLSDVPQRILTGTEAKLLAIQHKNAQLAHQRKLDELAKQNPDNNPDFQLETQEDGKIQ